MAKKLSSQESKAVKQSREGKLDQGPDGGAKMRKQMVPTKQGPGSTDDDIAQAQRLHAIFEYRKMGATLAQIGQKFDIAPSRVHAIITEAIAKLPKHNIEEVRAIELERCDSMTMALWPAALKGDIGAITTLLAIMNRRARYLGLDVIEAAPTDPHEKAANEAEARKALLGKLLASKKRIDAAAEEQAKAAKQ